ncbi:MAG: hypothetical protein ACOH1T_00390 [Microbacteriaceae bacterium]
MTRQLNLSALTDPIAKDEVAGFKSESRAQGRAWGQISTSTAVVGIIGGLFTVIVMASVLRIFLQFSLTSLANDGVTPLNAGGLLFVVIFAGLVVTGVVLAIRFAGNSRWKTWMRLSRFADSNGLVFSPSDPDPAYPGSIFSRGHSRMVLNHLRSASGRFLDVGNYRYTTGSGKNATTHNWGFLALNLDRQLPHMVLDSTANNGLFGGSNLGVAFSKDQVLSLEGDFDRHFTLYCPRAYERDALYVFTPDLMALLIDEAAPFDVEIVDNWMFIYSARPFVMTDPAVHERLFRIVDTVGAKTISQTERYADERLGDRTANIIAPPGRRLRSGVSIAGILLVGAFVIYWAFSFFGGILGVLGGN